MLTGAQPENRETHGEIEMLRPHRRPSEASQRAAVTDLPAPRPTPQFALLLSVPRPHPRPVLPVSGSAEQVDLVAAVRILPGRSALFGRQGSICGDPAIKGEKLPPVASRVTGCGVDDPVRVTSVAGVTLHQSAIVDCATARALNEWVGGALKPAFGRKEVVGLRIAGSYACRPRNNVRGAPISEHGRGKAVDIAAIEFADGSAVSVAQDWRDGAGRPMKAAYHAACGTFGTTLGPDSDSYHRDHMHFDTARQRGGTYCH